MAFAKTVAGTPSKQMKRALDNSENSPAKVSKTANSPKSARQFQESWLKDFPFIRYDAKTKLMYCELCLKSQVSNSFSTGCSVMKKESITKHVGTKDHKKASEDVKMRQQMQSARQASVSKSEGAVRAAMANIYFLAKENLPSSLVPTLNNFMMYQGVSHLADLRVDSHTSYEHSSSVNDFQTAISSVIEEELLNKVKISGKFSLMFDESTDISVHQNLIMYIRILETDNVGNVEPCTHFLGIDSLSKANAESIYAKVISTLEAKGIDLGRLCGVSTDGASVMVGNKSGVVTRLKADVPGVLATHCIAHRLALSCCTGADAIPYLVKVQETLNSIYKFFHYSPKNTAILEAIKQATTGSSSRFKEVFHTRWLSFSSSVDTLVHNFGDLVSVFLEENCGKALSLYKPITSYKFLYVVHFLADVLKPLSILSKMYQTKDLDYAEVTPLLSSTIESISRLARNKDGTRLIEFTSKVPVEPQVDESGLQTFEYAGHTIRDSSKMRTEAVSVCDKFADNIIKSLNERFSDNDDSAILTALSNFFSPQIRKNAKTADIETISEYLSSVGFSGCRDELEMFLGYLHALVDQGNKAVTNQRSAASLAIRKRELYPLAAEAAERLLVAPVSTVDCERGFSRQNLVKTCLRNRLSVETLDKLMRISLHPSSVEEFPFEKAFTKWSSVKTRRILN